MIHCHNRVGGWFLVGLRTSRFMGIALSAAFFFGSSASAFAATKTAKVPASPSIWDDAVNSLAHFINWVAQFTLHDYGLALIVVTILIRLITMPLVIRSLRNTKRMQALQPRLQELKKKYAGDSKKFQEETMNVYKSESVNPVAGCMPMLLQMVILWVLYRAIYTDQAMLSSKFLGLLPLGVPDHTYILPVLAAVTSYLQTRLTMVQMESSQKMIMYIFPVMIFFMGLKFDAGLALYWVVSNVFTIFQTYFTRVKPTNQGA